MKSNYQIVLYLLPLIIVQLAIQIFALIDLARREKVLWDNKIIWALIIIFGELIGSIIYFVVGRKEA